MEKTKEDREYILIAWDSHKTLSYAECMDALLQLGYTREAVVKYMDDWSRRF